MDWVKIIHLLCVMGWMTGIFAAPRAIIFWKREHDRLADFGPTGDLTIRIYRFSAGLGVIAIITGLVLGWTWSYAPWVILKIAVVALLVVHYAYTGYLVVQARRGVFPHTDRFLRIFNEISVLVAIGVLWIVVVKPLLWG